MDTNHSTRTPIPEIYTSSTKYFEVRDKKGYVSRTRKIPDDRKIFSRMECGWRNENCLRLRSRYRCGSRTKLFERSEFLIDTSQKKCLRVCPCVRLSLVLVWKTLILFLVWGTYYVPAAYTVNRQVVIIIAKVWLHTILRTITKTILVTLFEGGKT